MNLQKSRLFIIFLLKKININTTDVRIKVKNLIFESTDVNTLRYSYVIHNDYILYIKDFKEYSPFLRILIDVKYTIIGKVNERSFKALSWSQFCLEYEKSEKNLLNL